MPWHMARVYGEQLPQLYVLAARSTERPPRSGRVGVRKLPRNVRRRTTAPPRTVAPWL